MLVTRPSATGSSPALNTIGMVDVAALAARPERWPPAAEHERHVIGERTRHALAAAKARGIKLGNPEQAKINWAKAAARAHALRPHRAPHQAWPHIEQCHRNRSQTPDGGQWFPMQVRASAIVSANRDERLDRPHHIDLAEPLEHARIMPFRLVAFAYRSGINRCRFSRGVDFSPRPGFDNRLRLRRSDRRSRMRDPASRLHHGSLLRGPRDPAASAQR